MHVKQTESVPVSVSNAAKRLGRLSKGVSKSFTAKELKVRTKRLKEARKKRWPKEIKAKN